MSSATVQQRSKPIVSLDDAYLVGVQLAGAILANEPTAPSAAPTPAAEHANAPAPATDDARVFWAARGARDTPISEPALQLVFAKEKDAFRAVPEYKALAAGVAPTDCFWKHLAD